MATPNIVPRADSEGGLGTASKYWASAYIDTITTTSHINLPDSAILKIGDSADLQIQHNGTNTFVDNYTGNFTIDNKASDSDIIFIGNDGGSAITALTLDMSEGGTATFAGDIILSNGGGTSPSPKIEFFRQSGVSAYIQYDVANKILIIDSDHASGSISNKINGTEKFNIGSDGNATFSGQASAKGVRVTSRGTTSIETWNTCRS